VPLELALLAAAIEAAVGYPDALYRAVGHPVTWIGRLISWLDLVLNDTSASFGQRQRRGVLALVLLLAIAIGAGWLIEELLDEFFPDLLALLLTAVVASSLLAQRSLFQHVAAVAKALETEGVEAGRRAVSQIVGRDTSTLDESAISRAAIESLAENFSDGVVAPLFWTAVGGLAGGLAYKAVNTADSMIGHKSEKYLAFGWAAARFDDLVNLPASRLAALWIALAAKLDPELSMEAAFDTVRRDARHHRSPNAGWPEAAMAGALGICLAGPRSYGGVMTDDPYVGEGRTTLWSTDIRKALDLYRTACAVQLAVLAGLVLLSLLF
jgi:adenosylcobinamide-phosphate synthase